ncbi:MAG TPA: hypothetical protein VNE18_01590 [Rhodanobacter sp.]|nr:hypothetical protein [Rhodanobacter sp.]
MAELTILTDAKGRRITFKTMTVLDQSRIIRIIGRADPMDAQNQPYVSMAMAACSVTDIDGVPRPAPVKPEHIEAAIDALGDEGYAALIVDTQARAGELENAAASAKNSAATPAS